MTDAEFNGYGHVPGVPADTPFRDRQEVRDARVHRPLQAGICGTAAAGGAESIVVSGGYSDDEDLGDVIIYTGHGGRDPNTRKQVRDQEMKEGNAALVVSEMGERPVRVVRGHQARTAHSPRSGYRYDGLFLVVGHWYRSGHDGFRVWQFRLEQVLDGPPAASRPPQPPPHPSHPPHPPRPQRPRRPQRPPDSSDPTWMLTDQPAGDPDPERWERVSRGVFRRRDVADWVKQAYDHVCQVCRTPLDIPSELPEGLRYAEAAHIRGLGTPHDGPDEPGNALCLCPNHHKLFDLGAITIDEDFQVIDENTGEAIGRLHLTGRHHVDPAHTRYHRRHHQRRRPG